MKRVAEIWKNLTEAKRNVFQKKSQKLQKKYERDVAAEQKAHAKLEKSRIAAAKVREKQLQKEARLRQQEKPKPKKKKQKREISETEKRRTAYNKYMQAQCSSGKKEMLKFFSRIKSTIKPFVKKGVLEALPNLTEDEIAAAAAADIDTETSPSISQPASIVHGKMRTYQLKSLEWLLQMHDRGMSAILGDEMGLGKTLQSIAFLSALKLDRQLKGLFLVIVPLSVVSSWMSELRRWSPKLRVLRVHGSGRFLLLQK